MSSSKLLLLDIRESYHLVRTHNLTLEHLDELVAMVFVATIEAAGFTRDSLVFQEHPVLIDPIDLLYECDPFPESVDAETAAQLLHSLLIDLQIPTHLDDWLADAQHQPIYVCVDTNTATIRLG